MEQRDTRELVQPIQERQAGTKKCILGSYPCPHASICTNRFTFCLGSQCVSSSVFRIVVICLAVSTRPWPAVGFSCPEYLTKSKWAPSLSLGNLCLSVFLHRQRWEPGWCRPNDLFEVAECDSQAGLHLHLPEFCRLVWQCIWLLPACPSLQGQQRRGADASQKPLHQRRVRRMPGQCGNIMISSR